MPVVIDPGTAGYLFRQACKLVAGTGDKVVDKAEDSAEDWAAAKTIEFFRRVAGSGRAKGEERQGDSTGTDADIGRPEVSEAGKVIAENETEAVALQDDLGVELSSALPGRCTGTRASQVRAYEAVLWRLAVVASWEQRPIAVAGAVQGRDWVTVCVPKPGLEGVVSPSKMWKATAGCGLRRLQQTPPVEFFVWRSKSPPSDGNIAQINEVLADGFKWERPAKPAEISDWHRVDRVYGHWIALQPDSQTQAAVDKATTGIPDLWNPGKVVGVRHNQPLKRGQYPESWQPLLRIEADGLDALEAGIDRFVEASTSVREHAERLFTDIVSKAQERPPAT
jgi:hypothetical protein